MAPLSNAERQARHRKRLQEAAKINSAYEIGVLQKNVTELEAALNEMRDRLNLPQIQITKPAKR